MNLSLLELEMWRIRNKEILLYEVRIWKAGHILCYVEANFIAQYCNDLSEANPAYMHRGWHTYNFYG